MVGTSRRHILSTLIPHLRQRFALQTPPSNAFSTSTIQRKSPFESNLVRMLTSEIEFDSEYAPPHQTEKKFNAFMVEDRSGGQFVTLRGRSTIDENIKIEATMFDGVSPNMDEDDNEPNAQLHISLLVDIFKGEGGDMLEFVCSAWPQRLEIQKLYVIRPGGTLSRPYIGPDFRVLDKKLQSAMYNYLNARGVNNDLCLFLHRYVWNKDKIEHIQRLKLLKSYVEK
ncbi:putative mitochondrial glycoprotein [Helianthus debilis subsp. tardiflorus]